jgi:ankyrin repeat protein
MSSSSAEIDCDVGDTEGMTALSHACESSHAEGVALLLGVTIDVEASNHEAYVLCERDIDSSLSVSRTNPNHRDPSGRAVLSYACTARSGLGMVKLPLTIGGIDCTIADLEG